MSFPDVGNPLHALESTSNVLISFMDSGTKIPFQIYSDYTNYATSVYEYSRQLRFRVNTPANSNVFVDMGLDYSAGDYFYISNPFTSLSDPRNNLRINSDGKIFINYSTSPVREEILQINGDLRTSGNINPTITTYENTTNATVTNLTVTSLSCQSNIVPPVGIIVMWDGNIADIPVGWVLVDPGAGYYLRSNTNQTAVSTKNQDPFTINEAYSHTHILTQNAKISSTTHNHNMNALGTGTYDHQHNVNNVNTGNHSHRHGGWTDRGVNNITINSGSHNKNQLQGNAVRNTSTVAENHIHNVNYTHNASTGANHTHAIAKTDPGNASSSHSHTINTSTPGGDSVASITVNLTPSYRQIRLIKKLAYT